MMKATGVIRRLDDLGRIVIPKEIRRTFRIREGDPMEIFTRNLLKKGVFCTNVNFPLINCQISHHRRYFHPLPLSQFF